ncbi:MarR family winged helix-turn-helix transcriptional regulator [Ensifer adhaerens]|nr:MarR family winged helix-turn-helix transcriptional regulator [Ensifer adhaerens]UAY02807.1 MarR family winged helix-turn-helix transcriptional regulator [Ensifer adhaerens]UAY10791.1 MarR family winged helix-turn-helix transcriptional regulator [Ensifer adhaerens]
MSKEADKIPCLVDRIGDGLSRVATAMRSEAWTAAEAIGLNPTQLQILTFLVARDRNGMRVKQIAAYLGVSQPTTTDSVNALLRKGLVEKHADPSDARALSVAATLRGEAAVRQAGQLASATEDAIAALSKLEQEDMLMHLVKIIRRLQSAGAIPEQRMCVNCRYFRPHVYDDPKAPHHCAFVDAAFGPAELRVDCGEFEGADAADRDAAWRIFNRGAA